MDEPCLKIINTSLDLDDRAPSNSLNIEHLPDDETNQEKEQKQVEIIREDGEDEIGTEYFKNLTLETIEYLKGRDERARSGRDTISNLKTPELHIENSQKSNALVEEAQQEEHYEKSELNDFIMEAYKYGANALDLSKKNLACVPTLLSKLDALQYLYLEGNELSQLPDNFFSQFQSLKWLDLRNNKLTKIPSKDLATHRNLRYLLLENNQIKTLPIEIAHVKTLTALNLSNNPIEFPSSDVIEKGVKYTQEYLKQHSSLDETELIRRSKKHEQKYDEESRILTVNDDVWASDDENEFACEEPSPLDKIQTKLLTTTAVQAKNENDSNAELKRRLSRAKNEANLASNSNDKKWLNFLRDFKSRKNIKRNLSSFESKKLSESSVYKNASLEKALEHGKIEKYKKSKEQIDNRLQKVKDSIVINHFRDSYKSAQKKLLYKRMVKNIDFVEPVRHAPFDIDENYIEVMTNEERARLDDIMMREQMRAISPDTLMRIEDERRARDNYLQDKIREYTNKLLAKRSQPKGDAKQDRFQAAQDLRELKAIEKELEQRRMELQYRFRAYTGDLTYAETEKINAKAKLIRQRAKTNK